MISYVEPSECTKQYITDLKDHSLPSIYLFDRRLVNLIFASRDGLRQVDFEVTV